MNEAGTGGQRAGRKGFTLLELIVVVAIIAALAVAVLPASNNMMRGIHLSQSVDQVNGVLNLARHAAISTNHAVEVRFYQYGDPNIPGQQSNNPATGQYRSMQAFVFSENGKAVPLDKIEHLPGGVIMDSGTFSILLSGTSQVKTFSSPSTLDPQVSLPFVGTNYNTRAFQFRPDGSTNLAVGQIWYLTMHDQTLGDHLTNLPADFATIQIDPIGGSLETFHR